MTSATAVIVSVVLMVSISHGSEECQCNSSSCSPKFRMGRCPSCDPDSCRIVRGTCLFDLNASFSLIKADFVEGKLHFRPPLPNSCQELETIICGPMNRQGLFCSKCKPGYGPAPYSSTVVCFECKDDGSARQWLLYLTLELLPSTAFFFVVVFFNIRTTAPPYTAFVFFSQFFVFLYKVQPYIRLNLNLHVNKRLLQGMLTLISFWNLDFFRHVVPPFCISSKLTDLHVVFLDFISALYPLLLVVLTLVLIELHARNFRPLVILWKPVHKYFTSCRRKLDPKASVIAAAATFMTLSFGKVIVIGILALTFRSSSPHRKMSLYDTEIVCNDTEKCWNQLISTTYFLPLLFMLSIVHLPTLLLVLYPIKAFRRLLACCFHSKIHAINVFVDTFQGHYKDGTGGSRDYRAVSGISFLLRTLCCLLTNRDRNLSPGPASSGSFLAMIYLLVSTSLFYSIVQPCKKKYLNVIECVVYCAAGLILLSLGSFQSHRSLTDTIINGFFQRYLPLIILVLPSVVLIILSATKIMSCVCHCCPRRPQHENPESSCFRIRHPSGYQPLL